MTDVKRPPSPAARITGWVLSVLGALWTAGSFLFALALVGAAHGAVPPTPGESIFMFFFFGGAIGAPGIIALVIGLVVLRKR